MSHLLIVTRLPDDEHDDYGYIVTGEHDIHCETWRSCLKDWHRHPQNDYGQYGYDEWSTKRVPEVHQFIENEWMVKIPNGCGLRECDDLTEEIDRLGVYRVHVEYHEYWSAQLEWIREISPEDNVTVVT